MGALAPPLLLVTGFDEAHFPEAPGPVSTGAHSPLAAEVCVTASSPSYFSFFQSNFFLTISHVLLFLGLLGFVPY